MLIDSTSCSRHVNILKQLLYFVIKLKGHFI